MIVLAAWCVLALLRRRRGTCDLGAAAVLAVLALWWTFDSPAYEGPGILTLTDSSGIAAADLGVPPSLFLSAGVAFAWWRDRRQSR
ncbi:MAG: hypothetical protein JWN08_3794 [Frankiales bacterium]|nr:hypothetical protein [Frankiales bacterium]